MRYDYNYWVRREQEQQEFIEQCGGDLAGYRERYGDKDYSIPKYPAAGYYGDGATAIYEADQKALNEIRSRVMPALYRYR